MVDEKAEAEEAERKAVEKRDRKIMFKFHEGFSNAVRRTVLISDLGKGK